MSKKKKIEQIATVCMEKNCQHCGEQVLFYGVSIPASLNILGTNIMDERINLLDVDDECWTCYQKQAKSSIILP